MIRFLCMVILCLKRRARKTFMQIINTSYIARCSAKTRQRYRWFREAKGTCFYCNLSMTFFGKVNDPSLCTVDHVIPKSQTKYRPNCHKVVACANCNNLKNNMSYEQFKSRYPRKKLKHIRRVRELKFLAEQRVHNRRQ